MNWVCRITLYSRPPLFSKQLTSVATITFAAVKRLELFELGGQGISSVPPYPSNFCFSRCGQVYFSTLTSIFLYDQVYQPYPVPVLTPKKRSLLNIKAKIKDQAGFKLCVYQKLDSDNSTFNINHKQSTPCTSRVAVFIESTHDSTLAHIYLLFSFSTQNNHD